MAAAHIARHVPCMRIKKRIAVFVLSATVCLLLVVFICNAIVVHAASGRLYTDVQAIPCNKTGLLLGTSSTTKNGNANPYYTNRIAAAAALIKANKIKYLIISGDNGRKDYDEPTAMRADLIKAGVDSAAIYLDYAGFRTFDSIKRLKAVFDQDSVTIISQQFHNERALYIAKREGITAIGFNAADISARPGIRMELREKMARVKVFFDYWFGTTPKYLGKKMALPA